MSQIIACRSRNGIVLGADAHAVDIDGQGHLQATHIQRLYALNPAAVLMVGGGAESAAMAAALQSFLKNESCETIETVYAAALPFLASEYEGYMERHCDRLPIDPMHHIYFILAGHSTRNSENPYQAYLIWTKRHLPLMDGDTIMSAYAVPRLIQVEVQLNRMCRENRRLDEIQTVIQNQIHRGAQMENRRINASYAWVTADGVRIENEQIGA